VFSLAILTVGRVRPLLVFDSPRGVRVQNKGFRGERDPAGGERLGCRHSRFGIVARPRQCGFLIHRA
jgi:hypothetical protein